MELFFEAIIEYKNLKKKLNLDDIDCMKYYYEEVNYEKNKEILDLINDDNCSQIYCLEINNIRIITPSILICLDYLLFNNKNINISDNISDDIINKNEEINKLNWKIFNLKNI